MKRFLIQNDKSTIKDELYLFLFILLCILIGILLFLFAPYDWVIPDSAIKLFGVLLIITGAMFIPGLIYRLFSNDI